MSPYFNENYNFYNCQHLKFIVVIVGIFNIHSMTIEKCLMLASKLLNGGPLNHLKFGILMALKGNCKELEQVLKTKTFIYNCFNQL